MLISDVLGKRVARKDNEVALNSATDGRGMPTNSVSGLWLISEANLPIIQDNTSELWSQAQSQEQFMCGHCESPCTEDETHLTPCCRMALCPPCYELQVLENEMCPSSACLQKLSNLLKRVPMQDAKVHQNTQKSVNTIPFAESFCATATRTALSPTAKPFIPTTSEPQVAHDDSAVSSFYTAQASPPKESVNVELESLELDDPEVWDSEKEEKAAEARQTLEEATAHLIDTYKAMAEYLSEEERNAIIQGIVSTSGGEFVLFNICRLCLTTISDYHRRRTL